MPRTQLYVDPRISFEKSRREIHHSGFGRGDFQEIQENRSDPFIDQNAAMLRIIEEFDDVEMTVVAFEQMRLSAAAHLPDQACGLNQHSGEQRIILDADSGLRLPAAVFACGSETVYTRDSPYQT